MNHIRGKSKQYDYVEKNQGVYLKYFIGMLTIIMMLFSAGCGPNVQTGGDGNYTVMQDATGASVEVPNHPMRIVSMGVSTDDIVIPLVGTKRVVAISKLKPNLEEQAKEIKGRVTLSTESVMAYRPDLVILPSWIQPDFIKELRSLHLHVYVYKYPKNIQGSEELISLLGKVLHEDEKASDLRKNMENRLHKLKEFSSKIPENKRKVAIYYSVLGLMGGKGSTFSQYCQVVGLKDGAALHGLVDGSKGSKEMIVKINPDIIFIPSSAYDQGKYKALQAKALYDDPALRDVKAIKNKAVYVVDARWIMSYSQFIVNAMEQMAHYAYGYNT